MEKLKQVAQELIKRNQNVLLTGSLALNLQGYKTRREPSDIYISMPPKTSFHKLDGMDFIESSDSYDESDYQRDSYNLNGIKIDVFYPIEDIELPYSISRLNEDLIKTVSWFEILKFKLQHSFDDKYPDKKHREDIMWFLQNNEA
jgi:hypothetical protein